MKGRFQPTTVGNMARDPNGGYVCHEDYKEQAALLRECRAALDDLIRQKPTMAGLLCGSTTLGNLRAELHAYRDAGPTPNAEVSGAGTASAGLPGCASNDGSES
jgi:hypothetical protein